MNAFDTVTLNEAHDKHPDHRPLTNGYWPEEHWMLSNVIADMRRGGVPFLLVMEIRLRPDFISVWRKPSFLFRKAGEAYKEPAL